MLQRKRSVAFAETTQMKDIAQRVAVIAIRKNDPRLHKIGNSTQDKVMEVSFYLLDLSMGCTNTRPLVLFRVVAWLVDQN